MPNVKPPPVIYAEQPDIWLAEVAAAWGGVADYRCVKLPAPHALRVTFISVAQGVRVQGMNMGYYTLPGKATPAKAVKLLAPWLMAQVAAYARGQHLQRIQGQAASAQLAALSGCRAVLGANASHLGAPEEDYPEGLAYVAVAPVGHRRININLECLTAAQAMRLVPFLESLKAESTDFEANPPEWAIRQREEAEASEEET